MHLKQLWQEVNRAMFEVYDSKTFVDLVELERNRGNACVPNYIIKQNRVTFANAIFFADIRSTSLT